jgi:hypothetical protein
MAKGMVTRWTTKWLVDARGGQRRVPAFEFLRNQPHTTKTSLLQVVASVGMAGGPDRWYDAHLHARMEGDLADLHEARDKQGDTLYRLFLLWDRQNACVWMIDGRTKPVGTALSNAEYGKIRELADLIQGDDPPAAEAHDFATTVLLEDPAG